MKGRTYTAIILFIWILGLIVGLKIGLNYNFTHIEKVETTNTGCQLTFEDGTGYYIEF